MLDENSPWNPPGTELWAKGNSEGMVALEEAVGSQGFGPKMSPLCEGGRSKGKKLFWGTAEVKGAENTWRKPQQVQEELHVGLIKVIPQ